MKYLILNQYIYIFLIYHNNSLILYQNLFLTILNLICLNKIFLIFSYFQIKVSIILLIIIIIIYYYYYLIIIHQLNIYYYFNSLFILNIFILHMI